MLSLSKANEACLGYSFRSRASFGEGISMFKGENRTNGTGRQYSPYIPHSNTKSNHRPMRQILLIALRQLPGCTIYDLYFDGRSGTPGLTVTPAGGFTSQVNFVCAISGSPTGLVRSAASAVIAGGSSTPSPPTAEVADIAPSFLLLNHMASFPHAN